MIALIDYGMGNLSSVAKAFTAVGATDIELVSSPAKIENADAVVLPGVGNFGDGAENIHSLGLSPAIKNAILAGKPFLGICLGMQLLMEYSEEAPGAEGLGILKGKSVKFDRSLDLKIPQIGWNSISLKQKHSCLSEIKDNEFFYFVHSYYVIPDDISYICATANYGIDFCSCIGKKNLFASQFHPEKSQDAGLKIIKNFTLTLKKSK